MSICSRPCKAKPNFSRLLFSTLNRTSLDLDRHSCWTRYPIRRCDSSDTIPFYPSSCWSWACHLLPFWRMLDRIVRCHLDDISKQSVYQRNYWSRKFVCAVLHSLCRSHRPLGYGGVPTCDAF